MLKGLSERKALWVEIGYLWSIRKGPEVGTDEFWELKNCPWWEQGRN